MVDRIDFSLTGVDSLLNKLASVSEDAKRKGGRSSLRKAANLVAAKLKENAKALDDQRTGQSIADNVAVRWNGRLFKRSGDLGFRVGILGGAKLADDNGKAKGTPTPHWRLLEFGTEKMQAVPFARRALADNISQVTSVFINEYEKAIDRAIKRAAKGNR